MGETRGSSRGSGTMCTGMLVERIVDVLSGEVILDKIMLVILNKSKLGTVSRTVTEIGMALCLRKGQAASWASGSKKERRRKAVFKDSVLSLSTESQEARLCVLTVL